MMRMLVSVRSVDEALHAAEAGAQMIDLKEPRAGALGALAARDVERIVALLRRRFAQLPISATTGDFDGGASGLFDAVERIAACGVDYVKVGVAAGPGAAALIARLSRYEWPVVPVLLCDRGLDADGLGAACDGPFPAIMCDTRDKHSGSLFDCVTSSVLGAMVAAARSRGKLAGLAGALRFEHVAMLASLGPDFAGFRSAVCQGDRTGELDRNKVRDLARALRHASASESIGGDVALSSD